MSELHFQRGKSFEEVSRALTDANADTTARSILHAPEAHPAIGGQADATAADGIADQPQAEETPES